MQIENLAQNLARLPAPLPIWRGECRSGDWCAAAQAVAADDGRLLALWGSDRRQDGAGWIVLCAAYATKRGLFWLELPLTGEAATYPSLSPLFPCASRMQRAIADLLGIAAEWADDKRPWLTHGLWPPDYFPLRREARGDEVFAERSAADYPFVRVEGDGVHEIAVGPVHAGTIEPGHFRFSVVGEKVLRLEERLGYKHKGIEKRFEQLAAGDAHRLAGRVSGDSTVAFAWAYCMALESIRDSRVPARALALRALLLERERIANHLGDLGALGNDVAFGFGLAQFGCLREDWLRLNKDLFGHRLLMDLVVPGGVARDLDEPALTRLREQCDAIEREVNHLRSIYDNHAGVQDRFITTGRVTPELAAQLGLSGMAGRASGRRADLRADFPTPPYDEIAVRMAVQQGGDVAARANVRFDEIRESLRLIRTFAARLPDGPTRVDLAPQAAPGYGAGWVEGWRGEVFVALETAGERILRCHCHDPSWQNWPVLEHAIMGNIVPDFPLINKSFNLSYAGHDL